jgi:hypothetical protein
VNAQSKIAAPVSPQPLIGLAALARLAMRGQSLAPLAQELLRRIDANPVDAHALLDLSTLEQLRGSSLNRKMLLERAMRRSRVFSTPGRSPTATRLLVLAAPGDFMANTPIEFLLEDADIAVTTLYVEAGLDVLAEAPPHDVAFVAVAECRDNQPILQTIARFAPYWPRPLLNAPEAIASLTREGAWRLLGDVEGVVYPRNQRCWRRQLLAGARPENFPLIVRPLDSHAGESLEKIDDDQGFAAYLDAHGDAELTLAPFVDYRSSDGLFRKMRIACVDGAPFPVHLAISKRWMIHYLNADMAHNSAHRGEEARFFADFEAFALRHAAVFAALREKLRLDYFLLDCAEAADGRLLIFEVGAAMIAHDLDCPKTYPYKSAPMRRLFEAFQRMIASRGASLRQD